MNSFCGPGEPLYDSKAANWSNTEVDKLVDIWAEPQMQLEMDSAYRNFYVFEKISSRLAEYNIERTASQCRVKIKNLKSTYTRLKDTAPHELERLKTRNPAFHLVETVMTQKYNEADGATNLADDTLSNGSYIKIEQVPDNEEEEDDNYNEPDEDSITSMNNIQETQVFSSLKSPTHVSNSIKMSNIAKKRKFMKPIYETEVKDHSVTENESATNGINMKIIMKKIDKLQNTFQESMAALQKQLREERKFYMECEERRLKFFAELEEKRRRDERNHELKLFQLFTNMQTKPNSTETVTNSCQLKNTDDESHS